MAIDAFLKLDGIKGESHDKAFKGEIDILSWSWGATQGANTHLGGGGSSGKADFGDLSCVKAFDKSSSAIMQHCAGGKIIPTGLLILRKAGDSKMEYLKIKLTDIIISSYNTGSSAGEEQQTEQLSMNFAKIEWDYKEQTSDGSLGAETKFGYDIKSQEKMA